MEQEKSKKMLIIPIIIAIAVVIIVGIGVVLFWYNSNLKSVAKENGEIIKVTIEEGMGISSISELLEKNDVIKSATVMKIYSKMNTIFL